MRGIIKYFLLTIALFGLFLTSQIAEANQECLSDRDVNGATFEKKDDTKIIVSRLSNSSGKIQFNRHRAGSREDQFVETYVNTHFSGRRGEYWRVRLPRGTRDYLNFPTFYAYSLSNESLLCSSKINVKTTPEEERDPDDGSTPPGSPSPSPGPGSDSPEGRTYSHSGTHIDALRESPFKTVFDDDPVTSYEEWEAKVWNWALIIMIPLSILVLSAAGVLYMTSEGDSERIKLAKKLIIGVFSGIGLLILARLITVILLGEELVDQWWPF